VTWLPAPVSYVAFGAVVAMFAGIVRGFAGFGLSAFVVAGMSLLISPQRIVPAAMILEILASVSLLRSVWPQISWHWVRPLIAGYLVAVPLGVYCLSIVPELPLRILVSTIIIIAAMTLLCGFRPHWRDTIGLRLGTGLLAGFASGLSAVGGMIAATMLFTTSLSASQLRATLIGLFFMSSSYGLFWTYRNGLFTPAIPLWAAWLVVPMLLGIGIGRHGFRRVSEAHFRRVVLMLLAFVAALGLGRALLSLA
jgi:uncharacterized protein